MEKEKKILKKIFFNFQTKPETCLFEEKPS